MIFPFFDYLPQCGHFLHQTWTKIGIFDHLPTSSYPRSFWMTPGEKNSPTHHKIFLADHQGNDLTFFSSAEFLTLQNFSDWEVCRDKNFSNWLSFKISSSEWGKLSSHNNSWILTLEKWPPSANKSTLKYFLISFF